MLPSATRRIVFQRIQLQRTLSKKKNVINPLAQISKSIGAINTKDFLQSESFAYTRELGRELTESVMAKYFAPDGNRPVPMATNLSPNIIATMVDEITKDTTSTKIDYATLDMLADQAILSGAAAVPQIEQVMTFYMDHDNLIAAANVLRKCSADTVHISPRICHRLLAGLVENCNWAHAFIASMYMIYHDYRLPPDAVFFTMGGLLKTTEGVTNAVELIKVITIKKRADLSGKFPFNRINQFANSMNGTHKAAKYRQPIPRAVFEDAMSVTLSQLQYSGWFNFSQTKMLLALCISSNHADLAAAFVRQAINGLVERGQADTARSIQEYSEHSEYNDEYYTTINNRTGSSSTSSSGGKGSGDKVDVISLLRSFAQGDGAAQRSGTEHAPYTPVTLALLELCWLQPYTNQLLQQGPMRCMDLFNAYWVLAYRARDVVVHLPEYSKSMPLAVLDAVHADTQSMYDRLRDFWSDDRLLEMDLAPSAGYERRTLRILCDAFGFKHRLLPTPVTDNTSSSTPAITVRITKPRSRKSTTAFDLGSSDSYLYADNDTPNYIHITPPTLTSLLASDVIANPRCRQFDGKPLYYSELQAAFSRLDDEKLSVVVHRLSNAMLGYPSASWLLLLVRTLQERHIPLPLGQLRNGVRMCSERNDNYGLLEILHAAAAEQRLSSSAVYQRNLAKQRHQAQFQSGLALESYMDSRTFDELYNTHVEADHSSNTSTTGSTNESRTTTKKQPFTPQVDALNLHDWHTACTLMFRNSESNLPMLSKQEGFSEVMQLMAQCGVPVGQETLKTLLDFLVHTSDSSGQLWKIIERLCTDENVHIDNKQCVALSVHLIKKRVSAEHSKLLQIGSASNMHKNYLFVFPTTLHRISDLVLAADQEHWGLFEKGFREQFRAHWANLHHLEGRQGLYHLMLELLSSPSMQSLQQPAYQQARDAVTLLAVYTAYLISAHDEEAKNAFVVLAGVERMHLQAIQAAADNNSDSDNESDYSHRGARRAKMTRAKSTGSSSSRYGNSSGYSHSSSNSGNSSFSDNKDADLFARYQNSSTTDFQY